MIALCKSCKKTTLLFITHFFYDYTIVFKVLDTFVQSYNYDFQQFGPVSLLNSFKVNKSPPGSEPGVLPVSPEVFEPSLQVIEQVDLLAALGAVDVHELAGVLVTYLPRGLTRAANTNTQTIDFPAKCNSGVLTS